MLLEGVWQTVVRRDAMEGEGLSQRRLMSWSYSFGATIRVSSVAGLQRLYVAPENPNHKYPVRLL